MHYASTRETAMKPHERARAWRERRKLTREQLAELSGYTLSMIYKFEAGFQRPKRRSIPNL